ncbi:cyanophycinase [Vibrio cidicii]|uniref:Cyanophycinase n=1 Tax=Vibrio navarrensis TaxID=29495 RepID=A0AAI9G9Z4_9VIBR|nr:cyanophycinase [Vibrio navarrensis]ELN6933411.1 cyanophycinase [Vibrio navarrensis]ELV8624544.1 cyanophycinase [Vibrio cidicii]
MHNHKTLYPTLILGSSLLLTACGSSNTTENTSSATKQLFLGGGNLQVCSSMAQTQCEDWAAYRRDNLSQVVDKVIRTPVEEPVSVTAEYRARVINASAWQQEPLMQEAIRNALQTLDNQQQGQAYASWDAFKAAMLALESSTINVSIDGTAIDGEYLWYDSSSDQWDALSYLKMDDGIIQYTANNRNLDSLKQHFAGQTELISALNSLVIDQSYSYIELVTLLGESFNQLSIEDQFVLLRSLRNHIDYSRPVEYVAIAQSTSQDSLAAYKHFVAMAKKASGQESQPTILVMTSSSNNNYDVVDYYTALFTQAGAHSQWLPIDRAWRESVDNQDCQNLQLRHDVYAGKPHQDIYFSDYAATKQQTCENPALISEMIENADGLFINGGSQLRTLQSLITDNQDSPEMVKIRQRFEAGQLVIGGTSAGSAVQTGGALNDTANVNPMIDGGSSHDVLRDGYSNNVMQPNGGLALFHWGITDTHFSERARETRLITLAQQQGVRFGFGVDETTALIVSQPVGEQQNATMEVVGKNGVYIIDLQEANIEQSKPLVISKVNSHYLNQGDQFTWFPASQSYEIQFDHQASLKGVDNSAATPTSDDILYQDNYRKMASALVTTGAIMASGESYENDPKYQVTLSRQAETQTVIHNGKASYQHLLLEIAPK